MYIYNFLTSLELLNNQHIPVNDFPVYNVKYKDYYKRDDIIKKDILINKEEMYFLAYMDKDNPDSVKYLNIDEQRHYIDRLNQINIDLRRIPLSQVDTALYEVIVLFDKLSLMKVNPYIQCPLYNGIETIFSVYNDFDNLEPFENNPIKRDLFLAQFQYFLQQYLLARFNRKPVLVYKGMVLSHKLRNHIVAYLNNKPLIQRNVYRKNQELRDFLTHVNN